jgi:hypothetical protein
MTHDELLALLKPMTNDDAIFMKDALRAVVELHKRVETRNKVLCEDCVSDYPCPTIQAIEKELNNG